MNRCATQNKCNTAAPPKIKCNIDFFPQPVGSRRVAVWRGLGTPVQFLEMKRVAQVSTILWISWILLGAAVGVAAEPIASLHPTNYVNDFAGVLDAATQARLNDLCHQVEQKANAQIAVVTVKSVDGQDVVSYAVALYQKWGIGAKGKDRGVLILVATDDHKYWTTVGYGLEAILPDGKVGGFGREMVPLLRRRGQLDDVACGLGDCAGCGRDAGKSASSCRASWATRAEPWPAADCCHPHRHLCCDPHFAGDFSGRRLWTAWRRIWVLVRIAMGHAAEQRGRRPWWVWWRWVWWRRIRWRRIWWFRRWEYGWWRGGRQLVGAVGRE